MKATQFVIFFSVVLLVYSAVNYYIYIRGYQALPPDKVWKKVFLISFLFLSSSFIIGRVLEKVWLSPVSDIFTWIGSFWLAFMLYFFLIVLVIDIVRLSDFFLGFLPEITQPFKTVLLLSAIVVAAVTVAAGYINAISPRVKKLEITIHKKVQGREEMTVAFVSDIHLGTVIGPVRVAGLVNRINALNPELILLGGDIVDEDLAPVLRYNLGESLRKLRAPLGVIAVTGNHEYIGGAEAAVKYLEEHGVTILRDTSVVIGNSIVVAGREDHDKPRFAGRARKSLNHVMQGVDISLPVILLDHQPFELDGKADSGADLTLSGHTHHGQMWPLNFITKAIFEVSWGYMKKGNMHVYVSSGYGSWGPPVRTGNRPEIVFIKIKFAG
ncbi:MAG: metallophosphoesterase [Bacteroidales bacterium]|nr:metallophosphoesterase [Bacteroidales bacterium]